MAALGSPNQTPRRSPTRPTSQAPSRVPAGRRLGPRGSYLLAGVVALVGLLAAGLWAGLALIAETDRPAGFDRFTPPDEASVVLDQGATRVVYTEAATTPDASEIAVTGPDGAEVAVRPYRADVRYDVPGTDRVGSAVATFRASEPGAYRVAGSAGTGVLAIGPDLGAGAVRAVVLPVVAGALALALALAITVRATTRPTPGA